MSTSSSPSEPQPAAIQPEDACAFAVEAARIAAENRTEDVCVLDLRGLSSLTEFFVIGTGTSDRQMHGVLDRIRLYGKSSGRLPFRVADTPSGSWILADYIDVVVHLFDAQHREYYDLDGLWGDAPQIEWRSEAEAESPASGRS